MSERHEALCCCVCGAELALDDARRIGARVFCAAHFARALQAASSRWSRVGLVETGLVALFVAIVARFGTSAATGALPTSVGVGLLLALVPAAIWMVYAYRQDRIEPEPWSVVTFVFVLGALLAYGVARPMTDGVFRVREWQHLSTTASLVASVAVTGLIQQFCTYAAVRYTVYLTSEFDEPLDGMVYCTAAGLGVATILNVEFVVRSNGVLPAAGATMIAATSLVHVAAASILGYGLGWARFHRRQPQLWLAVSFLLSVLVNGGLKQLAVLSGISGAHFDPWTSLWIAAVVAGAILVSMNALAARLCLEGFLDSSHRA